MIYYYYLFDKSYFRLTDLQIDTLTLKMPFNHQNSSKNVLFVKKKHWEDVLLFSHFCLLKMIFLISELTFYDLEFKLTLKIILNH